MLHAIGDAFEVDVEDSRPNAPVLLLDRRAGTGDAGVVDEDVDMA
jgi:hypothetical protein